MFTGIIKDVGKVTAVTDAGADRSLKIEVAQLDLSGLPIGASIAVNGVCLTAVELAAKYFVADVSSETLAVTTLGALQPGAPVNIEPALRVGDSIDGHWVTGHVDGVGQITAMGEAGRSKTFAIKVPQALSRYVAKKGSIAVDGVSLTVNTVARREFEVTIIPHTQLETTFGHYQVGSAVNIEVDIVARYMERLTEGRQ